RGGSPGARACSRFAARHSDERRHRIGTAQPQEATMGRITRREFLEKTGIAAAGMAVGWAEVDRLSFAQPAAPRTLRLLQSSHFVPSHDKWFHSYAKEWGEKQNAVVVVDPIPADHLRSHLAPSV